jgi:hypothetical protein
VDYRHLNEITMKDAFSLPQSEDKLVRLSHSKVFSCLDGSGAPYVIPIHPKDRPKTAFDTPWGLFQYKRTPFGLTNGPASHSRLIQLALSGVPDTVALPCLDDTIVHSPEVTRHFKDLEWILRAHQEAGLKLQPAKCQLFQKEVRYLGQIVDGGGISPTPPYREAVKNWQLPTTKDEAHNFLDKVEYYRHFVKNYNEITGLWTNITGKDAEAKGNEPLELTEAMGLAFHALKQELSETPVSAYPRSDPKDSCYHLRQRRVGRTGYT